MPRVSPIITAFNAGELSPQLYGRVDVAKYASGCRTLENFVPLVHGPAQRRPGTYFAAESKTSAKVCRLIPFEFSVTQTYILEFGDKYIRFYKDQAQITVSGAAYEIVSPYAEADLELLKYAQDADTMYIVHPSYPVYKLTRTGHTAWSITAVEFNNGPYLDEQTWSITGNNLITNGTMELDSDWTSYGSPTTQERSTEKYSEGGYSRKFIVDAGSEGIKSATYTTTSSKCYRLTFKVYTSTGQLDVNIRNGANTTFSGFTIRSIPSNTWTEYTYFYQEGAGGSGAYVVFTSPSGLTSGTWYIDECFCYEVDGGLVSFSARTGTGVSMAATDAIFNSGHVGSFWRIRYPFSGGDALGVGPNEEGFVKVTAYTSAYAVTVTVVNELKDYQGTPYYSEGAISASQGYPSAITLHKQCMWLAGTPEAPQKLWRSVVGSYEDFSPGTDADDGFSYELASEKMSAIRWLAGAGKKLVIGTTSGEWTLGPANTSNALSPTNVTADEETGFGCADLHPINLKNAVLFVQRLGDPSNYGKTVRELSYDYASDAYVGTDLTLLAEHITAGGVVDWAYMSSPHPIAWAVRYDGTLLGMTYEKQQQVYAWHRHPMDNGLVESVAVIPGTYQDELWMVVKRTIGGSAKRFIEFMTEFDWTGPIEDDGYTGAGTYRNRPFFVDCGLSYDGTPATTISGLTHLAGQTVQVLADGATIPDKTVSSGGTITLSTAASVVNVGLAFVSDLEPMDLEAGSAEGTAQGKKKRIHEVGLKLYETVGGKVGPDEDHLDEIITRTAADELGAPPPLYSGDYSLPFPGEYETPGRILIRQDKPLPMTVLCLLPRFATEDR